MPPHNMMRCTSLRATRWLRACALALLTFAATACSMYARFVAPRPVPTAVPTVDAPSVRATSRTRASSPDVPAAAALVADPPDAEPDPAASDAAGVARLVRLAHVWNTIGLHHPWVATRGVPWDSALIMAAPRVRAATDDAQLATVYRRMFAILNDPCMRLDSSTVVDHEAPPASGERRADSIVVLRIAPTAALHAADSSRVADAMRQLSSRVLIDLRGARASNAVAAATRLDAFLQRTGVVAQLMRGSLLAPSARTKRIGVWFPEDAGGERTFRDGWQQSAGVVYRGQATDASRVVILADSGTVLPGALIAMHDDAQASLVVDGDIADAAPVPRMHVVISERLAVNVCVGELVHSDGSVGIHADTTISHTANDSGDVALSAALTMLRRPTPLPLAPRPVPRYAAPAATPVFYDTTSYPFLGARLLAGFRVWSAMRTRHAMRDVYDDDMDVVFARIIPRLEAARNATEYAKALADLTASLDDSEGVLRGAAYDSVIGVAAFPFRMRTAEGRVFITDILSNAATATLAVGTEVTAVDGFPVSAWWSEHRRLAPASNDWTRIDALTRLLSYGAVGDALLRVRDANNRERALTMPRSTGFRDALPTVERPLGAFVRTLTDRLMYVDVERLTDANIDATFAAVASATDLVLDLRGELGVDDTRLLRRLARRPNAMVGRVVQRSVVAPCVASLREAAMECPDVRTTYPWWRSVDTASVFTGRLVVLIDERTQGAMERFAMSLEQMATVTFIGGASAGSPSWTTPLRLPGGLTVGIATQELRRADGSPVQRLGLTPGVEVRPTARGLRNRDDEVLTRAQQWIEQRRKANRGPLH